MRSARSSMGSCGTRLSTDWMLPFTGMPRKFFCCAIIFRPLLGLYHVYMFRYQLYRLHNHCNSYDHHSCRNYTSDNGEEEWMTPEHTADDSTVCPVRWVSGIFIPLWNVEHVLVPYRSKKVLTWLL